ncbi:MAG: peptidase S51 dipeptidase E [Candidatus Peregrinibacteria bacterium Gr01-1014_25]|nr:MAG: peptidase S51 dipeptidase E [Candidatus Peregrinibacteria bacterium Gr01-1014_25]
MVGIFPRRFMKKLVAIGGGDIRKRATKAIDEEIIRLSGKKHPRLLFIPTASSDSAGYWRNIQRYFGDVLRCRTDVLHLVGKTPAPAAMRRKILSADIVYVGGGNTLKMMRIWRRLGVDRMLAAAYRKGIVLCGVSAGSICWFASGHSDSMSFYNPRKWRYINVKGLGLIRGVHCPHYDSNTRGVPRRKHFRDMIARRGGIGIAVENHCAVAFIDGKYFKILTSKPRAAAYRVYKRRGKVLAEKIPQKSTLSPVAELYGKKYT